MKLRSLCLLLLTGLMLQATKNSDDLGMAEEIEEESEVYPAEETPEALGVKLIAAACKDDIEKARSLINRDANKSMTDEVGDTALICATSKDHADMVELLLASGTDPNEPGAQGFTPLMVASAWNSPRIVEVLIANYAGLNDFNDVGDTALMLACKQGHREVITLLLATREGKIGVNIKNNQGETALTLAIKEALRQEEWKPDVVEQLLAEGADAAYIDDKDQADLAAFISLSASQGRKDLIIPLSGISD